MSEGEIIGLCTTGVASRGNLESLADRVSKKYLSGTAIDESEQDFAPEAQPVLSPSEHDALIAFRSAARALKAAEAAYRECSHAIAYRDAQQAYGEAVKRLSEEAVK